MDKILEQYEKYQIYFKILTKREIFSGTLLSANVCILKNKKSFLVIVKEDGLQDKLQTFLFDFTINCKVLKNN